jgi:uncharacterized membrane protein
LSRKNSKRHPIYPSRATGETRAADAATVAWMISALTTVLCGTVGFGLVLATHGRADGARMFGGLMHFSGLVSAIVTLVLTGFVLKYRKHVPPHSITWFAVLSSILVILSTLVHYV